MRILFQGAGAIGIAGAALFTQKHEVAVATRTSMPRAQGAYPRRVSHLDSSPSAQQNSQQNSHRQPGGTGQPGAGKPGAEWSVAGVGATRRVAITDWSGVQAGSSRSRGRRQNAWDLLVLTTRPGDLEPAVASAVRELAPPFLAITSQVDGDLEIARSTFPDAEVLIFSPVFLSERVDSSAAPAAPATPVLGRQVRYWAPAGLPRFLIAGRRHAVARLSHALGPLVLPVPLAALTTSPALFIPYVAELSVRDGSWNELKAHLSRPTAGAKEAVRAVTGLPLPMSKTVARLVLEALEIIVPIDVTAYAGRHFGRHKKQTLDMLEGWAQRREEQSSALNSQAHALRETLETLRR